jgi:hypothetical protein
VACNSFSAAGLTRLLQTSCVANRTDGGVSDTKANRKLWRTHAPEALTLLRDIKAAKQEDPLVRVLQPQRL